MWRQRLLPGRHRHLRLRQTSSTATSSPWAAHRCRQLRHRPHRPRRQRRRHRRARRGRHRRQGGGLHRSLRRPVGDVYAIDYVAHEMGHQMGGNHTFNGTQGNCAAATATARPRSSLAPVSRSWPTPASAARDNLQPHSDPYFSFKQHRRVRGHHGRSRPATSSEQQVVAPVHELRRRRLLHAHLLGCGTSSTVRQRHVVQHGRARGGRARGDRCGGNGHRLRRRRRAQRQRVHRQLGRHHRHADPDRHPVAGAFTSLRSARSSTAAPTPTGHGPATADHSPVVTAPVDKTIPTRRRSR